MILVNLFTRIGKGLCPFFHVFRIVPLLLLHLFAGCGDNHRSDNLASPPSETFPPVGRYAYARSTTQLLAISLDERTQHPITVATLLSESDFALSVERMSDSPNGKGRYNDLLLFNGGHVFWLSGIGDGENSLVHELIIPGFMIRSCSHTGKPDDPAISLTHSRETNTVVEVNVYFIGSTGCIDASGDQTLSIPLATKVPVVLPVNQLRTGLQPDGTILGTLTLGGTELIFSHTVNGVFEQDQMQASPEDIGRIINWRRLASDPKGVFLCGETDAIGRNCAIYYFTPSAIPNLTKLSPEDYSAVQMAGITKGRAYLVSNGPDVTGTLRMPSVIEFMLSPPFSVRTTMSLTPEYRIISMDQSVLFYAKDTIRYSQYYLFDTASGNVRNTDLVTYGSGSSSIYSDHRIGCVLAEVLPQSPEMSGCIAEAWVHPNNNIGDVSSRTVYLLNSDGTSKPSYAFSSIASAVGFVSYQTASEQLVGVESGDGSIQLWQIFSGATNQLTQIKTGDIVLYGTIIPRGSIL